MIPGKESQNRRHRPNNRPHEVASRTPKDVFQTGIETYTWPELLNQLSRLMLRFLPIILGGCVAIVSALIAAIGILALADYERLSAEPFEISCKNMLTMVPNETYRFRLTDWKHGKNVYPVPVRDDGEWESVYVCLFPKELKKLRNNYSAVVVRMDGVTGTKELKELFSTGELDVFYKPAKQEIETNLYSRMAQKYRSMTFEDCVQVHCGGPPPSDQFGRMCFYGGLIGLGVSVAAVVLFYLFKLLKALLFRQKDPWADEEPKSVSNRAGLPIS